jgi:hypothetical protein
METGKTGPVKMTMSSATKLNAHEQEVYLRHLISRIGKPDNQHESLTAKAYRSILECLQADVRRKSDEADND